MHAKIHATATDCSSISLLTIGGNILFKFITETNIDREFQYCVSFQYSFPNELRCERIESNGIIQIQV